MLLSLLRSGLTTVFSSTLEELLVPLEVCFFPALPSLYHIDVTISVQKTWLLVPEVAMEFLRRLALGQQKLVNTLVYRVFDSL